MTPRSEIIQKSLNCLDFGMASLLPGLGVIAAPFALLTFRTVVVETNDRWNPARVHLYVGAALAVLGLLAHGIIGTFVYLKALQELANA